MGYIIIRFSEILKTQYLWTYKVHSLRAILNIKLHSNVLPLLLYLITRKIKCIYLKHFLFIVQFHDDLDTCYTLIEYLHSQKDSAKDSPYWENNYWWRNAWILFALFCWGTSYASYRMELGWCEYRFYEINAFICSIVL